MLTSGQLLRRRASDSCCCPGPTGPPGPIITTNTDIEFSFSLNMVSRVDLYSNKIKYDAPTETYTFAKEITEYITKNNIDAFINMDRSPNYKLKDIKPSFWLAPGSANVLLVEAEPIFPPHSHGLPENISENLFSYETAQLITPTHPNATKNAEILVRYMNLPKSIGVKDKKVMLTGIHINLTEIGIRGKINTHQQLVGKKYVNKGWSSEISIQIDAFNSVDKDGLPEINTNLPLVAFQNYCKFSNIPATDDTNIKNGAKNICKELDHPCQGLIGCDINLLQNIAISYTPIPDTQKKDLYPLSRNISVTLKGYVIN